MAELPDAPWATKDLPDAPWTTTPKSGAVGDFFKSIPRGVMSGLASGTNYSPEMAMGSPSPVTPPPAPAEMVTAAEKGLTGDLHKPEGRYGKIGAGVGEALGNPASWVGPGGPLLKAGGAILSGAGGEVGGQLAEGTKAEPYMRVLGAMTGGVTAAKTLGPTVERAAVPTGRELKDIGGRGYETARNMDLRLRPEGPQSWAAVVENELSGPAHGFSPNPKSAPGTFDVLAKIRDPIQTPADLPPKFMSGADLETVRKQLGSIAQEVQQTQGGPIKATPDARAAKVALERLKTYTENIPESHILAGDAKEYSRQIKEANANYAAGSRAEDFDTRLTKAERATDRQVAGSLDSQIKSKAGTLLDSAASRGMNDAEKAQLELINSGTATSNILRQLGRGGAGVIPMGAHIATAAATGGASIPASLAIGAPLYASRKIAEAMTKSRARDLVDMLAKRSPEYEQRAAAIPQVDNMPNKAAILRAMMNAGAQQ